MYPAEKKQGISTNDTYKIEKEKTENKIKGNFKRNYEIQEGFLKILEKGEYIKGKKIGIYIKREYHPEIIQNLMRIWRGEKVTKNMKEKLDTWDKENRSNERFFLDTISAWLGQDYILSLLIQNPLIRENYTIYRGGTDAKRKITKATETDGKPDIYMIDKKTGEKIYMEVMEDNYGYIKKTSTFDLRWRKNETVSKYLDLLNLYKKGFETYIVILDVKNKGLIFVPAEEMEVKIWKYKNENYKGKYCTKLKTDYKKNFKSFKELKIVI